MAMANAQEDKWNLQGLLRFGLRTSLLSLAPYSMGRGKSHGQTQSQKDKEIHFAHKEAEARAWRPGKTGDWGQRQ